MIDDNETRSLIERPVLHVTTGACMQQRPADRTDGRSVDRSVGRLADRPRSYIVTCLQISRGLACANDYA